MTLLYIVKDCKLTFLKILDWKYFGTTWFKGCNCKIKVIYALQVLEENVCATTLARRL